MDGILNYYMTTSHGYTLKDTLDQFLNDYTTDVDIFKCIHFSVFNKASSYISLIHLHFGWSNLLQKQDCYVQLYSKLNIGELLKHIYSLNITILVHKIGI